MEKEEVRPRAIVAAEAASNFVLCGASKSCADTCIVNLNSLHRFHEIRCPNDNHHNAPLRAPVSFNGRTCPLYGQDAGSIPATGTILSGLGILAVLQPSKLTKRVQFSQAAPSLALLGTSYMFGFR